jgi:hypothetical protein
MLRPILSAAFLVACAVPAAAQGPRAHVAGIPWGVTADSVIRMWGTPADRMPISRGLEELDYEVEMDGAARLYYIVIHPVLGAMIAGYTVPFDDEPECEARVRGAVEEITAAYPRFRWEAGSPPDAAAVCAGGDGGSGQDPENGTRMRVSLDEEGSRLVADGISAAGFTWLGNGGGG